MSTINVEELQRNPEQLVDRVQGGESFLVLRDGRPVAELRPIESGRLSSRPIGLCAGDFVVPDDFDSPLPDEILREFQEQ